MSLSRTLTRSLTLSVLGLLLGACGDDGSASGGPLGYAHALDCASVPACYTDALKALRQCVSSASLAMAAPKIGSGVVDGATCSATDLTVSFSSFSEKSTGIVPTPSSATIQAKGATCATLGWGTGQHTDGKTGTVTRFTTFTIKRSTGDVTVSTYENGVVGVSCGSGSADGYGAAAGALASCPKVVLSGKVTRDDAITKLTVELLDQASASETLFTCSR